MKFGFGTFANKEYIQWGVVTINEQTAYKVPGNSHTSRHAFVQLLYCEKTVTISSSTPGR